VLWVLGFYVTNLLNGLSMGRKNGKQNGEGYYHYQYNGRQCSKGEKRIALFLDKFDIEFIQEHSFEECVGLSGNPLTFDFYLVDFDILIEYQGLHHFHPLGSGRRAQKKHEKVIVHDGIKKEYACTNDLSLLAIHWEKYHNICGILSSVLGVGRVTRSSHYLCN